MKRLTADSASWAPLVARTGTRTLSFRSPNIASLVSQVPSVTGGRQCDFKGCLEEQPNTAQAGLSPRAAIESSDGDQVSGFVPASGKQSRLQDQDPVVIRTEPSDNN